VALATSTPSTWAGGRVCPRSKIYPGGGVTRSADGGWTWKNIGLPDPQHIYRAIMHPRDAIAASH
jgi:hypothetical protein